MDVASPVAFEEWYRSLHPRLVTAITAATGESDVAADAADEACSRALERWDRVQGMASPEAWTFTVGLNVARRRFRRRRRERELVRNERGPGAIAGPAGELWAVVAVLPQRQREAVVLRHVGQLTEAEVAEVMGVKRGTVSSTLRAAYQTLRTAAADLEEVSDG